MRKEASFYLFILSRQVYLVCIAQERELASHQAERTSKGPESQKDGVIQVHIETSAASPSCFIITAIAATINYRLLLLVYITRQLYHKAAVPISPVVAGQDPSYPFQGCERLRTESCNSI
jgi:hypothetical protein